MSVIWSRSIERSRPEFRSRLIWASGLFGLLLLAEFFLLHQLLSRDLSQRHMVEAVTSYRRDVEHVARRIGELLRRSGSNDLFAVRDQIGSAVRQMGSGLAPRTGFHHISVYDGLGQMVVTIYMAETDLRTFSGAIGREVGDRPPGALTHVPGLAVHGMAPGAHLSGLLREESPTEAILAVPITAGAPDDPSPGVVQLGLDSTVMEREVTGLREDLQKKVMAWAFLSIVVLIVGFLYVLKLLQRTRRLEAEAQHADRLAHIGTLASGLAHEIRNPLNAMNMNLQMIEEELSSPEADLRDLLETTRAEIGRLDRLVNSFLAYARPSPLAVEPRQIRDVLEGLVQFLRAEFAGAGVELRLTCAPDLPAVAIDEGQIRQALMNILINARQALTPGQRVEIEATPAPDGDVAIRIGDNGPGIPPERLALIFEAFYSTRPGGTGLGLPIAQRIIEAHGGRIEAESTIGRGTTFRILLRRRPPVTTPAPAGAEPMPADGAAA